VVKEGLLFRRRRRVKIDDDEGGLRAEALPEGVDGGKGVFGVNAAEEGAAQH
jgi:hypothetical protein